MSEWRGVPLPSAILVINDSKGARACTAAVAANRLDYAARRGRFAERGEIEREPTRADEEAMRSNAERALDYISREGDFAWKGAGRQVDASLWDVSGPISREEALRSMTKAGCYIESVLSVDRRHADALGLSDKESMQRLVQSTSGHPSESTAQGSSEAGEGDTEPASPPIQRYAATQAAMAAAMRAAAAMAARERASAAFLRPAADLRLPDAGASVDHSMRSSVPSNTAALRYGNDSECARIARLRPQTPSKRSYIPRDC